ncbi:hypothetical protein PYH37_000559 [Sinorhizobium numidicum]|uniref:VapC50 C-terminal domain-containing protein n=1 Tax=Sinorhizobium numidicum TaxID=680248 RepID=A0ABY8CRA5_9HYPH|nr:hypothetical protein [Sinorhizobium numidicum]WEX75187.1 hypothetical protein PYH37_000559 [Sinorhizobium numidicum]WEX81180.1 hypothetical protein PYH38_000561 [Sinorhizobium numidicum]
MTDNLKDFPEAFLGRLNLEARSADAFIADTVALDTGRAVAAIRRMRERFKKPEKTAAVLLLDMEANGLTETVDVLQPHFFRFDRGLRRALTSRCGRRTAHNHRCVPNDPLCDLL